MNTTMETWLTQLLATDAPSLPSTSLSQIWLWVGWSLVLASIGAATMERWVPSHRRPDWRHLGAAMLLGISSLLPGPYAPAYWLGLAFQAPSVVTVLLCAGFLTDRYLPSVGVQFSYAPTSCMKLSLALLGALMGWLLLLDTFAVLPVQLYAWGFGSAAVGLVTMAALVPWVVSNGFPRSMRLCAYVSPLSLLVFLVWRLPTGNVWDALLDPWLWVALQGYLLCSAWKRLKNRGASVR